jgi:hypothetical protein
MIVCLLIIFSCAGMKTKRGVQDNIFYSSSNPKINIKINPDFAYTGSGTNQMRGHDSRRSQVSKSTGIEIERYKFFNKDLKRNIEIKISTLTTANWYWRSGLFDRVKNKLDSGVETISGKRYQYCVFTDRSSSGTCWLVKGLGRIVSANSDSVMHIYYSENLEGKYTCSDWENKNLLTDDQKVLLDELIECCEKDIQILKTVEIMGGTQ